MDRKPLISPTLAVMLFWLAAVLVRLAGIKWGLPHTFNADEPHIVNLAVSFGGGSLRPYDFKYPTLWPYLLAFCYGIYFLVWSCAGMRKHIVDFIGLFAWNPTGFYLIGRAMAAGFSLAALSIVWKTSIFPRRKETERIILPWAALLLAFAPTLIESAHSCKPDCLMFFFACAAWFFAIKVYRDGSRFYYFTCGACLGLALSAQYTALPLTIILPMAHFMGQKKAPFGFLAQAIAAAAIMLLCGSPFILIDFSRFIAGMRDISTISALERWSRMTVLGEILTNLFNFAGAYSLAGLSAILGAIIVWRQDKRLAAVLISPLIAYILIFGNSSEGGWARYLFGAFPGMALLAGEGLTWLNSSRRASWTLLLVALALGPGLWQSALMDRTMRLPDTRLVAGDWISKNLPAGSTLLVDEIHASPHIIMTKEEAQELAEKALANGSPRQRLYQAMATTHPGGGYRIYRIKRSARDLHTYPEPMALTQADDLFLDLSAGISPARAAGVRYVITSSMGATPQRSPELLQFFSDLARQGRLIQSFSPSPGKIAGPQLDIYSL